MFVQIGKTVKKKKKNEKQTRARKQQEHLRTLLLWFGFKKKKKWIVFMPSQLIEELESTAETRAARLCRK